MASMWSDHHPALGRADAKRAQLRHGLTYDPPVIAVGAHDAMSARLIEGHGFDAVWVSGFGVSAMAYGLPDLNVMTMSETLAVARNIDGSTDLPVIVDCDNGFGGFSNVVRTAVDFDRAGVAAICIEDNLFPKRNSLYSGATRRELVGTAEQARRLRAAKAAQESPHFVLIARVEALIAGHGVDAAIERATAYAEAGADAILIHSKDRTLTDITGFLEAWSDTGISTPLVAVPTLFPDYTAQELQTRGFSMVIFANQAMRASVRAMEDVLTCLRADGRPVTVEPHIASVEHVFDLVHTKEAIAAEEGDEQT